ncbi:hypothetical protein AHAS_Ahas14G0009000 [Arachis hypogaea]
MTKKAECLVSSAVIQGRHVAVQENHISQVKWDLIGIAVRRMNSLEEKAIPVTQMQLNGSCNHTKDGGSFLFIFINKIANTLDMKRHSRRFDHLRTRQDGQIREASRMVLSSGLIGYGETWISLTMGF